MRTILTCIAVSGLVFAHAGNGQGGEVPKQTDQKTIVFKEPKVEKGDIAVLKTNLGIIKFELFTEKTPKHAANFEKLADAGFYNGTKFHRVIPGFMIQGGDPNSKGKDRSVMGQGGPGWNVPAEFNDTDYVRGIVGMARSQDPDSAGSQFFIMVHAYPSLNKNYTAFGKVIQGMDVADKIVALERDRNDNPLDANPAIIESVEIHHHPVKEDKH